MVMYCSHHGINGRHSRDWTCVNCGPEVPITAVECTSCEYRIPNEKVVTDFLHLLIGNLLTITVTGAIVGLSLMRRALRHLERQLNEL